MYSHEIEGYIKQHNYRLNTQQLEFLMDTREHPQINHIKYNDWTHEYEMWTKDNFYFKFQVIPYEEYINSVKEIIQREEDKMEQEHYRLYAALESKPYEHIVTSPKITDLFIPMDVFILQKDIKHSRYLVIHGGPQGDNPIYLGFGDKIDYLTFKKTQLEEIQEKGKVMKR